MIPKKIFQIWINKYRNIPEECIPYMEKMKKTYQHFEYKCLKNNECHSYVQKFFPEYFTTYMKFPKNIQRVDFFKMLLIYNEGGFYFDNDVELFENIDSLCKEDCIFPYEETLDKDIASYRHRIEIDKPLEQISNFGFGASKNNKFILKVIKEIVKRAKMPFENKWSFVYYTTGPDVVTSLYYKNKNDVKILYPLDRHKDKMYTFGKFGIHHALGSWKK